jgi:hypothetical protein
MPEAELEELTAIYVAKGNEHRDGSKVWLRALTAHDSFAAHVSAPQNLTV